MKTLRSLSGRFTGRDLGSGVWRLSTDTPGGPEIHLAGVEADGAETLSSAGAGAVEIAWRPDGVLLTLSQRRVPIGASGRAMQSSMSPWRVSTGTCRWSGSMRRHGDFGRGYSAWSEFRADAAARADCAPRPRCAMIPDLDHRRGDTIVNPRAGACRSPHVELRRPSRMPGGICRTFAEEVPSGQPYPRTAALLDIKSIAVEGSTPPDASFEPYGRSVQNARAVPARGGRARRLCKPHLGLG